VLCECCALWVCCEQVLCVVSPVATPTQRCCVSVVSVVSAASFVQNTFTHNAQHPFERAEPAWTCLNLSLNLVQTFVNPTWTFREPDLNVPRTRPEPDLNPTWSNLKEIEKMTNRNWVSTSQAAKHLGVSNAFLLRNRLVLFEPKVHWRSINPHAARPSYRWNLENLEKMMGTPIDY